MTIECQYCKRLARTLQGNTQHEKVCEGNPTRIKTRIGQPSLQRTIEGDWIEYVPHSKRPGYSTRRRVERDADGFTEKQRQGFEKISEKVRSYYKNNPDAHPWKRHEKFVSVPCETLKQGLRDAGVNFVEEYQPLEDRLFSVDIAFPDRKFAIEVNGNQHYNKDGTLKDYYRQRHDLITAAGWKLLELPYKLAFDTAYVMSLFDLSSTPDYSLFVAENLKAREKVKAPKQKARSQKIDTYADVRVKIHQLHGDGAIDFKRQGWVNQIAPVIGITPPKVNAWMRREMPEFLQEHCKQRIVKKRM